MRFYKVLLVSLLVVGWVTALDCNKTEAAKAAWPKTLTMATVHAGSPQTVYGMGVAAIIEKYLKIPTAPEANATDVEAISLFMQKKADLSTFLPPVVGAILRNEPPWPADGSKMLRGLTFGGYLTDNHWTVRADSSIYKFEDLKGKKVMCRRVGSINFEEVWRVTLAAYGMKENDIIAMPELSVPDQAAALKEGRADCAMHYGAAPHAAMVEMETTCPVRVLSHTEAGLKKVMEKLSFPVSRATLPIGIYKGQKEPALIFREHVGIAVRKDLPDDLVYAIAKAVDEHIQDLRGLHGSFKKWTIQSLANSPYFPYHPGAYKYYMEKGYLTPESIQKHKEFLSKGGDKS